MTHFIYRKDDDEISERDVIPIGFTFGDRDKVLCLDLSKSGDKRVDKEILGEIRDRYMKDLYDHGYGHIIRSFFLDNIEEISE